MSSCFRIMRQVPNIIHKNEYQYNRFYRGAIKTVLFDKRGIKYNRENDTENNLLSNTELSIIKEISDLELILDIRTDAFMETLIQKPSEHQLWMDKHQIMIYEHHHNKLILDHCLQSQPISPISNKMIDLNDVKIGILTDFSINISKIIQADIKSKGYHLDYYSSFQHVENQYGPFLLYHNLDVLNVKPIQSVIKLDNTERAVYDSLDAGCWSVGIADWRFWENIEESRKILTNYGSHYVIDSINELPMVVDDINLKMYYGEKP